MKFEITYLLLVGFFICCSIAYLAYSLGLVLQGKSRDGTVKDELVFVDYKEASAAYYKINNYFSSHKSKYALRSFRLHGDHADSIYIEYAIIDKHSKPVNFAAIVEKGSR